MNMSKMPIAFGGTFVDNSTRATDPSYSANDITSFKVYGTIEGNNIFNGVTIEKSSADYGSAWTQVDGQKQYWVDGADYVFVGIVDGDKSGVTTTTTNTTTGLPTSISYKADGATDLLCQTVEMTAGENENRLVAFSFTHLLSKVYFTFVSTSQPLAVTDVKVTGHFAKGTYTINDQQWSETTPATTALIFGDADGQVTTEGTTSQKACLIIPGKQTWTVSLNQGDEKKTATLTDFVFEPNKAYNILVTLQGASQITFTVNNLEAWDAEEKNVNLNF